MGQRVSPGCEGPQCTRGLGGKLVSRGANKQGGFDFFLLIIFMNIFIRLEF